MRKCSILKPENINNVYVYNNNCYETTTLCFSCQDAVSLYIKYSSIEKLQINNIYISKYLNELSDKTERLIL